MSTRIPDNERFCEWWRYVEPYVLARARSFAPVRREAEDVTQDVAIVALSEFDSFTDREEFRKWVCQRANWFAIDRIRLLKRESPSTDLRGYEDVIDSLPDESEVSSADQDLEARRRRARHEALFRLLKLLPVRTQEVAIGRMEGKSDREIAREMKISTSTVRSHFRHAKHLLAKSLEEDDSSLPHEEELS